MKIGVIVSLTLLLAFGADICAQSAASKSVPTFDRFGDALPRGALMRLGTSRFRHGGEIYSMCYSGDGRFLVTGNAGHKSLNLDSSVVVWGAETGKRIRTWFGHAHVVRSVAISPDNKLVGVVNGFGKFVLYDVATGKEPRRFSIEDPGVVLFAPDGSTLFVTDHGKVRRWKLAEDKEFEPLVGHEKLAVGLALAADGKTIATYVRDGAVRVWDVQRRERRRFAIPTKGIYGATLSPDGTRLACGTAEEEIQLWDTTTGRLLWKDKSMDYFVGSQAFSRDGKMLITGGRNVNLREAASGKVIRTIDGLQSLGAFSPDGTRIVTAGRETAPRFWDAATAKEIRRFEGHQHAVLDGAFAPDGKTLATISDEPFVHLWNLASGATTPIASGQGAITSIAFAPDGKTLVTSAPRQWPSQWDLTTGKHLRRFTSTDSDIAGGTAALSADGKVLAASTGSVGIRFWNTSTGQEHPVMFRGRSNALSSSFEQYPSFVLSPDGKSVATTRGPSAESGIIRWDLARGEKRPPKAADGTPILIFPEPEDKHFKLADRGAPAAFTPDGRLVAILADKEVRLVDADTGLLLRRLTGDSTRVICAGFSPDGRTLASAGEDKSVHLWETATAQRRDQFASHEGAIHFVAFAPEGRRLASGGADHTALIWDLPRAASKERLSAQDLDTHWNILAGADGAKAWRTIWSLAANAEQSVPFLKTRLHPCAPIDPKRLSRLLSDLDSEHFAKRQQSSQELEKLAEQAIPVLRKAVTAKSTLEFRRRVESLLTILCTQPPLPEQLRQLRCVEILEHAATPAARQVLQALAAGAPEARVTQEARSALDRLSRANH